MKHHINLYGAEFRPRRLWASLPQMALVWGGVLVLLLGATLFYGWQQQGLDRELAGVRAQLDVQRGEARRLDAELARHLANADLQRQLADKREELGAKQALMQQLGHLSLQRIEISDGRINLAGVAERSQDVPAWVNRFKQTPSLAGKQFGELTLSRDKEGQLAFQLSGIARETP